MFFRFLTCSSCLYLALSSSAQTGAPVQSPRDQLSQWTKELQDNPENQALREKIIKLAATIQPPPAVSEDAKRHMARGKAAFETAKSENDFGDAVSEFKQASLAAPWWGAVYFNLGRAEDKLGDYAAAKTSLNLYLLSAPPPTDAEDAKSLIYEVEFKLEKRQADAQQKSAQASAVREKELQAEEHERAEKARRQSQKEQACAFARNLDGARYVSHFENRYWDKYRTYVIQGCNVFWKEYTARGPDKSDRGSHREEGPYPLVGREFTYDPGGRGTISEDGKRITVIDMIGEVHVYEREK